MSELTKMDPKWKRRWCEALRSGKYRQGRGQLATTDNPPRYCCLGVLACLMAPTHPVSEYYFLPAGKAGLTIKAQCLLVHMNDTAYATFDTIADYIEENL